jgi:hypothetical protein
VIMMLKRPAGLFPSQTRKAELLADEDLGEDEPVTTGAVGAAPGGPGEPLDSATGAR